MTDPLRPVGVSPQALAGLIEGIAHGDAGAQMVSGITLDSRAVRPGWLYVALPGTRQHGAAFAQQAVERGAAAVLTDGAGAALAGDLGVPVLVADELRSAMGVAAARVFDHPAAKLKTFGITGTNGKTTTAFLLAAALPGVRVGTIGTIGFRLDGAPIESGRTTVTTPESPDLQALLAVLAERGAEAVAIEVSSHALELHRVSGMTFDVAAFINLGRDHLDFHGTLDAYFAAKAKLFTPELARRAVINVADAAGAELADACRRRGLPVTSVGLPGADYWLSEFRHLDPLHTVATLHTPWGGHELRLALPGAYNALNAMIAVAMAGGDPASALGGLTTATIPGRMQHVELSGDDAPFVVVDFAHTPQAVAAALATFEAYRGDRRVIAVLGAGGDRDTEKRAPMGRAAADGADLVIVTDDNPRSERPGAIRAAVLAGVGAHARTIEVPDRAEAIGRALAEARPGDVVAVLGKGHETGQIVGDRIVQFDDVAVVRQQWTALKEDS